MTQRLHPRISILTVEFFQWNVGEHVACDTGGHVAFDAGGSIDLWRFDADGKHCSAENVSDLVFLFRVQRYHVHLDRAIYSFGSFETGPI